MGFKPAKLGKPNITLGNMKNKEIKSAINRLVRIADRGEIARLRCYQTFTLRTKAYPVLGDIGFLGVHWLSEVASMWAVNQNHKYETGNLGAVLRKTSMSHPTIRAQFENILASDRLGAIGWIGGIMSMVDGIDYVELATDLLFWGDDTKLKWAKSFWTKPQDDQEPSTATKEDPIHE